MARGKSVESLCNAAHMSEGEYLEETTVGGIIVMTVLSRSVFLYLPDRVRNCCLSCSPKPVDFMENQQLYNLDGPLDQQHFIVTKLQYEY